MIPDELQQLLPPIDSYSPVSGGDIHLAFRAQLSSGQTIFIKTHHHPPPGIFQAEAHGLNALNRVVPGVCPQVIAICNHGLALEWCDFKRGSHSANLGRTLAQLHQTVAPGFGGQADNYLATVPQRQPECSTWCEMYRDHRLLPLLKQLPKDLRREVERLLPKLESILDLPDPPSWLHGDLWAGNAGETKEGRAVLFDPAVSTGHREQDLAMTMLFGGFDADFYDAYNEVYPLTDSWRQRVGLHQLYPLLIHVILFGAGYVMQARSAIKPWL